MVYRARWHYWLPRIVGAGDVSVIILTMLIAQFVRFGTEKTVLVDAGAPYWLVGVGIGLLWLLALSLWRAWEVRIVGSGTAEYLRVTNSTLALFGILAIFAYVFDVQLARGYVAAAVTLGVASLLSWRWISRQLIVRLRRKGYLTRRLVVIGGPGEVLQLYRSFERSPSTGLLAVGAILPGRSHQSPDGKELPLPVLSVDQSVDAIMTELRANRIEVVAATGGGLKPRALRRLSWELADHDISLILAPALTDVAGPRIHSHPVADVPLIHVSTPRLDGFNAVLKRSFDIMGAVIGLVVVLPILLATAIAIKLDDGGPILFTQHRVGRNHTRFKMYKFRSMIVDAEDQLAALQDTKTRTSVLFKMKDDPRITRVGRFIRKYSIDELPQLFNVVLGTMSMVGPRPPLETEVAHYGSEVMRRLTVMPGITGLWQVGGRSDLNWEESVRLDLYYVENWSILQDLSILFRTVRVVIGRDGAY